MKITHPEGSKYSSFSGSLPLLAILQSYLQPTQLKVVTGCHHNTYIYTNQIYPLLLLAKGYTQPLTYLREATHDLKHPQLHAPLIHNI